MDERKDEKKTIPARNIVAGIFGIVLFVGVRGKMSGTAAPGSYTALFDTALIVIGSIGAFAALLWPSRKLPPERKEDSEQGAPQ